MFQGQNAREIFEELNREFSRSGVRSGNNFFQTLFFGGAVGGLGRILRMVPGPIGRIGMGLKLAQVVGTSLYTLHKMKKAKGSKEQDYTHKSENPIVNNLKGIFGNSATKNQSPLDMRFSITIPAVEAINGTRKKISYKIDDVNEQLMVHIPPKFPSGGKLKIRNKGHFQGNKRGDLILSINIDSNVSASK